jgi:hypothetical protein
VTRDVHIKTLRQRILTQQAVGTEVSCQPMSSTMKNTMFGRFANS